MTREELEAQLTGRGSVRARLRLSACDGRSRSGLETVARLVLSGAGFRVSPGVRIEGVGEVDLLVERRIVVECDGFAYHSGRYEYREDRRRDRALAARGLAVLRFTYEDVMSDPARLVAEVRRVLVRRPRGG
ncbi:DUF559 domain-containing protein [Georgenia sp. 10Sc9-8]|uniref:DUF559 domain-containing protein n=1 Tax=Georgenia halotolerans TaxID=3028317 RepID=A0ABT5U0Z0_9MICO|nr:DUF559 domain-containing protein [Georgenia halotolerans]